MKGTALKPLRRVFSASGAFLAPRAADNIIGGNIHRLPLLQVMFFIESMP